MVRFLIDEWLPPKIRESKWIMYPLFYYWFKGQNLKTIMNFKNKIFDMPEEEYIDLYRKVKTKASDRPTDLNDASIQYILQNIPNAASNLLDVGCGRGAFLETVQKTFPNLKLFGCDILAELRMPNIEYQFGAIENLPYASNSFDVTICSHTIEHLKRPEIAIQELKRVTKDLLIIVTPRQRYCYLTLDLHINFFPLKGYLENLIQIPNSVCEDIDGDWVYIGKLS